MLYVGGFFGVDTSGSADFAGDFVGAFGNTDAFVGLPLGRHHRTDSDRDLSRCPQGHHLPAGNGCVPGLHCHDFPDSDSDARRQPQGNDQLPRCSRVCARSDGLRFPTSCTVCSRQSSSLSPACSPLPPAPSWGTFGILIPVVTAVFPTDSPLLIIGISACCAGAVCGDHCSPISDTTIMASAGAQCNHLTHVSTQLPMP